MFLAAVLAMTPHYHPSAHAGIYPTIGLIVLIVLALIVKIVPIGDGR